MSIALQSRDLSASSSLYSASLAQANIHCQDLCLKGHSANRLNRHEQGCFSKCEKAYLYSQVAGLVNGHLAVGLHQLDLKTQV